jgi:hypothetical protein
MGSSPRHAFLHAPGIHDCGTAGRGGDACFANINARVEHGGHHLPTSTTVEVRRLSHPDFLIEVEVMEVISELEAR